MKENETRRLIQTSFGIGITIVIAYFLIADADLTGTNLYRASSTALSIVSIFWLFFVKSLWKYRPFNWLSYRPNINGTWGGHLESNWVGPDGKIPPKRFFIVVHQDFLTVRFTTFTDNFMGVSYSENFLFDENRNRQRVVYLYMKDTADGGSQERNEGVAELRIMRSGKFRMEGKYWTNINTKGSINVEWLSGDFIDSYKDGLKLTSE